jgi:dehydratase
MAALGAVAALGLTCGSASAADSPLSLDCQATPPIVSAETFTIDAGVNGTAPATVAAGSAFTVTLAPDAITVPSSVNGNTVNNISALKLTAPVPANATLTSETLSGGSGLGSGTPTVSVSGGIITLAVPGPINGGSTFTLPTLNLNLTAGASGGTVQTQLAGSSYSSPGLTFTANVTSSIFTVNAPTACYPSPNPVLTSTTVS